MKRTVILLLVLAAAPAFADPGHRFAETMALLSVRARSKGLDPWALAGECAREPSCAGACEGSLRAWAERRARTPTDREGAPLCAPLSGPGEPASQIRAFVAAAAARAHSDMSATDRDMLDCALFTLGVSPERPGVCEQADAATTARVFPMLAQVAPSNRLWMMGEFCAELFTCAGACTGYLSALSSVDPDFRLKLEPCPDAAQALAGVKGDARRVPLQRWIEGTVLRFVRRIQPRLTESDRKAVECALGVLGLAPKPAAACPDPTAPPAPPTTPTGSTPPGNASVEGVLDRALVQKVVSEHMGEVQRCYERTLVKEREVAGKIVFEWVITTTGAVGVVGVKSSDMKNTEVARCILGQIQGWRFPKPTGGPVTVVYPFVFSSL